MPSINGNAVLFNGAALAAVTTTGTTRRVTLEPEPLSGDHTQQVWATVSWEGMSAGSLVVNVYCLPLVTVPASASRQPVLVATHAPQLDQTPAVAAAGVCRTFIEVAGPNMYAEAVVVGAGTPDVTVYLESTGQINLA
jgi:hypothetical protein